MVRVVVPAARPSRDAADGRSETAMPRYFFHLDSPRGRVTDPDGMEFDDPDRAWEAARDTARELMKAEPSSDVNWLTCSFVVTDAAGGIVFELPFSEVVEVPPRLN